MENEPGQELNEFWDVARHYAFFDGFDFMRSRPWYTSMAPPAWSFGDTPQIANELLALVLARKKTATSSLLSEYGDADPLPKANDLSIILDGYGHPGALIRDDEVCVIPFADVTAEQAAAEGEGDCSLAYWRAAHLAFWQRQGITVDDSAMVVHERFTLLYPKA